MIWGAIIPNLPRLNCRIWARIMHNKQRGQLFYLLFNYITDKSSLLLIYSFKHNQVICCKQQHKIEQKIYYSYGAGRGKHCESLSN